MDPFTVGIKFLSLDKIQKAGWWYWNTLDINTFKKVI